MGKSLHKLHFPVLTSSFRPLFDLPDAPSAVPPTSSEWVPGRPVPKPWRILLGVPEGIGLDWRCSTNKKTYTDEVRVDSRSWRLPAPSYLQRCPLAALAGPLPIDPHAHRCDLQDGSGYLIDVETHACKELWGLEGCQVGGEHRARAAALLPVGYPKCVPSPLAWPGSLLFHVLCSAARQSARPFRPPQNWLVAPVWYRVCGSFDHKESVEEYDMVRDTAVWQLSGVPMLMAWRVGSSSHSPHCACAQDCIGVEGDSACEGYPDGRKPNTDWEHGDDK